MQECQVDVLGFNQLKEMYKDDLDFKEIYEVCDNLVNRDRCPWTKYMLQEGLLFRGIEFCIPRSSMRNSLLQEKHGGGLGGHLDKIRHMHS